MCKNLVEKGNLQNPLLLFNRTQKRSDDLSASLPSGSSKVAKTIADAVGPSDVIFICLGDDAAVQEAISTALKGNVKDKLFVDCSTIHPDTTSAIAKQITDAGAGFVAMPVFGAPAAADAGQLVCVLAGPAELAEKVKPFTTGVLGRAVIDFSGQEPSKATLLKIIGNTFILNMVETLSEGLVLSEKTALGTDNLHQFISTMFPGPYTAYSDRMRKGDYYKREEPLFAVDLARKDAGHALKLAEAVGCRMKAAEVADGHLKEVKEHMGARGDIAGIYGAVRKEGGLKFELE
jgi:3-hydroxyisobutyrate dehydrogenase-like beta-hydroxyacid dehydrogenase